MALAAISQRDDHILPRGTRDVRGWPVRTLVDRKRVGEVHDLLVDEAGVPRYLDVDLGLFRKHVLLPVGHARADAVHHVVWVPGLPADRFRDIPAYEHDLPRVSRAYEAGLVTAYRSAYRDDSRPRPAYTGTVYGPSELEDRLKARGRPRLQPLEALDDVAIADGEPDPRGWDVVAEDGVRIGTVERLLVDISAMKVRYLVCAVDEAALSLERRDRRILLPVGFAHLDEDAHVVRLRVFTSRDVAHMPVEDGGAGGRVPGRATDAGTPTTDPFYRQPPFDPHECFGPPTA